MYLCRDPINILLDVETVRKISFVYKFMDHQGKEIGQRIYESSNDGDKEVQAYIRGFNSEYIGWM